MGRITVVHSADLHLGAPCPGVPPHIGRQRRKDLMQTLARISEVCREQQIDLLLISGDLWEEEYITRPLVDFVADQFRRIPATTVVIAPGQSDCNHRDSFYREYPWSDNVHIFHQPELANIWIPHLNTRIYGRAWTGEETEALNWNQLADNSGCQVVVVAYGNPESLAIPQSVMAMDNLAYLALGGSHKHVAWSGKALDPGCPEPLGFDQQGVHGFLQGSIGTASGALEFVALNGRQYYQVQVDTESCSSESDVAQAIKKAVAALHPEKNLFRVELLGRGGWNLMEVKELLTQVFFITLLDQTSTSYDVEALATEHNKGVIGKYIAAIKQSPCNDKGISKRALVFGLDALLSGRVVPW